MAMDSDRAIKTRRLDKPPLSGGVEALDPSSRRQVAQVLEGEVLQIGQDAQLILR